MYSTLTITPNFIAANPKISHVPKCRNCQNPDRELEKFIIRPNTAGAAARYPDDLANIQAAYTEKITQDMISKSREVLKWVRTQ